VPLLQALILGIVQGLTEFLPISSHGHLVLLPFIFGWEEPTLSFIVAVHLGTTLSILWVFRERLVELMRGAFGRGNPADGRFVGLILLATIPAAILGAVFSDQIDRIFDRPVINAFLFAGTAWILFTAESVYEKRDETQARDERMVTAVDAGAIGVAQAVAILPSISRSGATIAAGMVRGLSREAAAKFSFLMAIPIILGAVAVKIPDMIEEGAAGSGGAMLIGVITSTVAGVLSIRAMLGVVAKRGYRPFAIYCLFAMTAGLLTALARG
jgi:undecaprenyl-diphosphatase